MTTFCFFIQFLEKLLRILVNFTLSKYVKSQRGHVFLITKDLIFDFQILDLKDHFSVSLKFLYFYFGQSTACHLKCDSPKETLSSTVVA